MLEISTFDVQKQTEMMQKHKKMTEMNLIAKELIQINAQQTATLVLMHNLTNQIADSDQRALEEFLTNNPLENGAQLCREIPDRHPFGDDTPLENGAQLCREIPDRHPFGEWRAALPLWRMAHEDGRENGDANIQLQLQTLTEQELKSEEAEDPGHGKSGAADAEAELMTTSGADAAPPQKWYGWQDDPYSAEDDDQSPAPDDDGWGADA
jgi:hypothetical protein